MGSWMLILVFSGRLFMVPSNDLIQSASAPEIRGLSLLDGKRGETETFLFRCIENGNRSQTRFFRIYILLPSDFSTCL